MSAKILIIDDDLDILNSFNVFLINNNYECSVFENFDKVPDFLESNKPDLIISDFNVNSELNGVEFYVKHIMEKDIKFALHSGTFFPTPNALHSFQETLPGNINMIFESPPNYQERTTFILESTDKQLKRVIPFFSKPTLVGEILQYFQL